MHRWVDDYFSAEPAGTADHAVQCFVRLVDAVLGLKSIADDKQSCSNPLPLLGLTVSVSEGEMAVWPDSAKADKWLSDIDGALESGRLCRHDAAKLAGRLSFTAQNAFFRLGRAMLRPIFQQQYKPLSQGRARPALRMALRWWRQALAHGVGQRRRLEGRQGVVDIFCDAASTPAKVAAVLVAETGISYTVWTPDEELMGRFLQRKDKQICGLELLGAPLGKQLFISPRTRRGSTT